MEAISEEEYGDEDYAQTEHSEYNFQNRMQNNYQPGMTKAELRRSTKPIMEKRRRARINRCLNELKSLILDAMKKDPARHSKLEKADILEMTVKHLQDVQKRQLSAAMIADPAVMRKFRGGFAECATEVSRYIDGLEGIDMGVRRRLATHLTSCVTNLPAARSEVNDTNNNNSARLNAISGSLRLIPSRLPNGELALLVPDGQSLPNNVLPFFQLTNPTKLPPNVGHKSFCEQVSTTSEKVLDILRLDTSPSHPSAFTAVNKTVVPHDLEQTSPTPSVMSSVSSSGDRNVPNHQKHSNNMSSEVSSTSEQTAESSSTDPSSSFNSSTSSLSPQNIAGKPQPLNISSESPQHHQNKILESGVSLASPQFHQRNILRQSLQCTKDGCTLPNSSLSPSAQMKLKMDLQRDVRSGKHSYPKEVNAAVKYQSDFPHPDFVKTADIPDRLSFPKQMSTSVKYPQEYTFVDGLKVYEPFPTVTRDLDRFRKRELEGGLDLTSSQAEFTLPLTVETNFDSFRGVHNERLAENKQPTPIDFSKNVVHAFQNFAGRHSFEPSLKRRRLEGMHLPNFARSDESADCPEVMSNEGHSFSPRVILHEKGAADDGSVAGRNNGSNSDTSGGDSMWRPW